MKGINVSDTQLTPYGNIDGIRTFQFGDLGSIRMVEVDGQPWFVGSDLARMLEYRDGRDALRSVRDRNKGTQNVRTPGGLQECVCVNEPGLYELIMRSRSQRAEAFQDWVTDEVLPTIRRTGSYSTAPKSRIDMLVESALELQRVDREQRRLAAEQAQLERQQIENRLQVLEQAARIDGHDNRLEALEERHGWVSALGYAKANGLPTDVESLNRLGRVASVVGGHLGLNPSKVHSTVWGQVNAWPTPVWDEAIKGLEVTSN